MASRVGYRDALFVLVLISSETYEMSKNLHVPLWSQPGSFLQQLLIGDVLSGYLVFGAI